MSEFIVTLNNKKLLLKKDGNKVDLNNNEYNVDFVKLSKYAFSIKLNNKIYEATAVRKDGNYIITINGKTFITTVRSLLEEKANEYLLKRENENAGSIIKAPMPGLIVKVLKTEGETVEKGEPVIILEAMKMENEIRATASGKVKTVKAKENSSVEKGAVLLEID